MRVLILTLAAAIAIGAPQISLPTPADAASAVTSAENGKRKINLAGRQRMLSQRMAKAVCFASLGVDRVGHIAMARDAHALFNRTLNGLRAGDASQGLSAESNPRIVEELNGVKTLWSAYGPAIETATSGDPISETTLKHVALLNTPTLHQAHEAVEAFERAYGSTGDIHPALALALNVSGRQRMLSQRASKEFCLIAHGVNVDENRAALRKSVSLFERSLAGLIGGDEDTGLVEAPTREIADQLAKVERLWAPLREIFNRVADGADPAQAEIKRVADDNNPLLVEMNKAVWMYDAL